MLSEVVVLTWLNVTSPELRLLLSPSGFATFCSVIIIISYSEYIGEKNKNSHKVTV